MSVSFAPYVYDTELDQWVVPGTSGQFEMSLCNVNADDVLDTLGLPGYSDTPIPIDTFSQAVTTALRRRLGRRSPEIPDVEHARPGKMTIIHGGREEGYIEKRLGELAVMLQAGRALGATHFGWG